LRIPGSSRHDWRVAKDDGLFRVGRSVADRRGELGMTQQDLADAAGVDLKTIYNLESGQRWPIAKNRVKIAAALKWAPESLAAIRDGSAAAGADAAPAPSPGFIPVLDADDEAIAPYEQQVRAEILQAMDKYGLDATGVQVFPGSSVEQATWDTPQLRSREEKVRLIAKLRMIIDGAGQNRETG
jgi:transcriptional regulator with XRE-family HTH domain